MSHAYLAHRCIIRNPLAVRMACEQIKTPKGVRALRIETAEEVCKRKGIPYKPKSKEHPACGVYRSYRTDNGRWVGDYPSPPGMKPEEVSFNADFVISLTPEAEKELNRPDAYEIGLVWVDEQHAVDPVTEQPVHIQAGWYPVHDFWQQGRGIESIVGQTKANYERVTQKSDGKTITRQVVSESHGKLMQMVRQMEELLAVKETADEYHRIELPDGSVVTRKYPNNRVRQRA